MALPKSIDSLPNWSSSEANRWADFVELSCLNNIDQIYSLDDLMDHFADENADELERGNREHSSIYDKKSAEIENYFKLINYRSESLGDHYPFEYDASTYTLTLKSEISDYHLFYFFLVFCSNLSFFDRSTLYYLAHAFEEMCCSILEAISPSAAKTEIFGTSRDGEYSGNLRKRLKLLAENLSAVPHSIFDDDEGFDVSGGDGGLDLVSYLPLDGNPFIPFSFAQCACSYEDWIDKQYSISAALWEKRFGYIAPYLQYTFVPFYWRRAGGDFEKPARILTCLIDRHRILSLLQSANTIELFQNHEIYDKVNQISGVSP